MKKSAAAERLSANVRRLRAEQGITLAELAQRLDEAGYPIGGLNVLSRIELGNRTASVDDLEALAGALGTTSARLLADPLVAANAEAVALVEEYLALLIEQAELAKRSRRLMGTRVLPFLREHPEVNEAVDAALRAGAEKYRMYVGDPADDLTHLVGGLEKEHE